MKVPPGASRVAIKQSEPPKEESDADPVAGDREAAHRFGDGLMSAGVEVEEFRTTVLARQTEAEEAIVHGDPRPRMELWSKRDPVTLFGAIGMSESGWEQLSRTFTWVSSRFSRVTDFRFDVELVEVHGELAYTLGFERWTGSIAGRAVEPVTVRVTHIYRREDGEWKIVHRHADNPGRDPRTAGELS
jgi:ketosteroid isomerase-like protein